MKKIFLHTILFLWLMTFAFGINAAAQNAEPTAEANKQVNAMSENDSLPFMQNQAAVENAQPSSGGLLLKSFGAMLLIVGLIFFGAWALKKSGFSRFKQNEAADAVDLSVLSTISMGGGRTISAVRFGERVLLVGSTAQNFTLLADEDLKNSSPAPQTSRSVADLLNEEKESFGSEFEIARTRLDALNNNGGLLQ